MTDIVKTLPGELRSFVELAGDFPGREAWPPGPWDTEPDLVLVEHAGFTCFVKRQHMGALCGYIAIPPEHPWHGKHYDALSVSPHGGLTFSKPMGPYWCLGFDCLHHMDLVPGMMFGGGRLMALLARQGAEYRDVAYVTAELHSLAERAREAELRCFICDGAGWFVPYVWVSSMHTEGEWIPMVDVPPHMRSVVSVVDGQLRKQCLTCNGTGVSASARLAAKRHAAAQSRGE